MRQSTIYRIRAHTKGFVRCLQTCRSVVRWISDMEYIIDAHARVAHPRREAGFDMLEITARAASHESTGLYPR